MLSTLAVVLPLVLAAVFAASGIAKLRRPDDVAGWTELGVPRLLRKQWLLRFHPWGEVLLGLALALLGGVLGLLAALVGVALVAAYLVLVVHAYRSAVDASCACFGARRPVTRVTIVRNLWLLVLTVAAAAVIWANPLWGGAMAAGASDALWIVGLVIATVTVGIILWPEGAATPQPVTAVVDSASDDDLDYIRTRTPAVPVTTADGTVVNLRTLALHRPLLLLAVSETCGACAAVIESAPEWRRLLPELDVRMLLRTLPGTGLTELGEPQSLHDPEGYVSGSIEDWPTPTAVLIGADGFLAGGPVTGNTAVESLIHDVYESLHGARRE